jgi:hypothetical protein
MIRTKIQPRNYTVVTEDQFSALAQWMQQTTITVYSSRERVNVIIPGTGYRGEGNNFYRPVRGKARNYLHACVKDAAEQLGWTEPNFEIESLRPDYSQRGKYRATVWRRKPDHWIYDA